MPKSQNYIAQYNPQLSETMEEDIDFNEVAYLPPPSETKTPAFPEARIEDVAGSLRYEGTPHPVKELGYPE